jgi:hypothetical protein
MKALLAVLGLLIVSACVRSAPIARPHADAFRIVLEATPTGWSAQCEAGCQWRGASFGCATACGAIVDANGLVTLATPRPDSSGFSFVVERAANNGARAYSRGGTAWKTLSWECGASPCRVRIDASGVSGQ